MQVPLDTLSLSGEKVTSRDSASGKAGEQTLTIAAPGVRQPPSLAVHGPNEIGWCDTAVLIAEGTGGRGITYEWSSFDSPSTHLYIQAQTGSSLSLPGSILPKGVQVTVSVTASNFLGAKSAPVLHLISRKALPAPLVSMNVDPPPYKRSEIFSAFASAKFSQCASAEAISALSFSWVLSKVLPLPHPTLPAPSRFPLAP